jgi:hypothetical protein
MKDPQCNQSPQYFLTLLAGIARALEDLGYRDEAGRLFRVKKDLGTKVMPQMGKLNAGDESIRGPEAESDLSESRA